jgi:hypothetical protein
MMEDWRYEAADKSGFVVVDDTNNKYVIGWIDGSGTVGAIRDRITAARIAAVPDLMRLLNEAVVNTKPHVTSRWEPGNDRPVVFETYPDWVNEAKALINHVLDERNFKP